MGAQPYQLQRSVFCLFCLHVQATHLNDTKKVWHRNKSSEMSPKGIQRYLANFGKVMCLIRQVGAGLCPLSEDTVVGGYTINYIAKNMM